LAAISDGGWKFRGDHCASNAAPMFIGRGAPDYAIDDRRR